MEHSHQAGKMARVSLLAGTVLGTMSNNIINVPLRTIARDFHQPIATAVLGVIAFSLFLAVAMPLTGWLGDRFGRKLILCAALVLMVVAQLAAALAPSLPFLIFTRAVQGLACSAIPPIVMGELVSLYPARRSRMMGAWAAANGIGQAAGPPIGGIVSDLFGWRSIFFMMSIVSSLVLWLIIRHVPASPPRESRLHLLGAFLLTTGIGLVLVGTSGVSQAAVPYWMDGTTVAVGFALLLGFGLVSRGNPRAMIPVRFIFESRFARSAVAAFAQMFTLGTVLVAIPLFLTGPLGLSTSFAGTLFFALPLTMAIAAPIVGRRAEAKTPRSVLRAGLLVIIAGTIASGWSATSRAPSITVTVVLLIALGAGMAMVQTPAATGATRSPAGAHGAALGLFNLLRFSGSTAGAAWVALLIPRGGTFVMYVGCAVVAAIALLLSFTGTNPIPDLVHPHAQRS
jgi:MFS family permease